MLEAYGGPTADTSALRHVHDTPIGRPAHRSRSIDIASHAAMTRPATRPAPALLHRPWRRNSSVAILVPATSVTTVEEVLGALDAARNDGFTSAMSPALEPAVATAWLAAGFEQHEPLLLFHHDLTGLPDRANNDPPLRRATGLDRHRAVAIDRSAFHDEFWRFDDLALREAMLATRQSSFRIDWRRRAYAVSGVADGRAFLQRLAVSPNAQRRGLGRALALDALRWARSRRARSMSVNTQIQNIAARSLYERLGFRLDPGGLVVLRWVPR